MTTPKEPVMIEISWRYDPTDGFVEHVPSTPAEALALLDRGNRDFAALGASETASRQHVIPVSASDLGLVEHDGAALVQEPFTALLACADARVPPELVFLQSANDAFVVRVAGNVLGAECVGSIDYALAHLPSLRLLGVMGHTGCGAVAAAVDCYLAPAQYLGLSAELPLRSIVDSIMAAVHASARSLRIRYGDDVIDRPGFRAALIDTAVVLNAAVGADAMRTMFADRLGDSLGLVFGVYNLANRQVGIPIDESIGWTPGLTAAPHGDDFLPFLRSVVASAHVAALLYQAPAGH